MRTNQLIREIYRSQYSHNALIDGPFGKRYLTYADYIASGQPLRFIEDFIHKNVLPTYANTHTESSFTGRQSGSYREEARNMIKRSVNADKDDILIFTGSGSTGAIDLLYRKLVQFYADKEVKPTIFIGPYEHHSNILPWREGDFELVEIGMNEEGGIDLLHLENELKERHLKKPLIGSFSAASNVTGVLSPVKEIVALLKNYDALSFWDYAGGAPYMHIDMNPENEPCKDALFISTHKLIGGPGTPGVLVVKKQLFESGLPVITGGGTVNFVTKTKQRYFEDIETREEGGTPAIIESIRAGLAFQLKDKVGAKVIEEREELFIRRAIDRLQRNKNIFILGNPLAKRLGFLAFHIRFKNRFLHHNFVVALLNDLFGIQSRGGCSCAGPYGHDLLELSEEQSCEYMVELSTGNVGIKPGWVRLNFNYFIPEEEFEFILMAIEWIAENGWKLMPVYVFDDSIGIWKHKAMRDIKLGTLDDLCIPVRKRLHFGTDWNKRIKRKSYFRFANKLTKKAHKFYNNGPYQSYKFPQLDNSLRWYALAQDASS
jgi:selenocysteine lyase/cysteine desulfurase